MELAFHKHLDQCKQCREHPFALCPEGTRLLKQTVTLTQYEQNIVTAFKDLCKTQPDGASPAEVTRLLHERKQLSKLDSTLDIEKIMRELRNRGEL